MEYETSPEPLYELIRKIRRPAAFRELIAACLRSIYNGDPFSREEAILPAMPPHLLDEIVTAEETISGLRCVIYSPTQPAQQLPLMLYMHGGGFVVGCSEDTDYVTRMLCYLNRMIVVSLNYRLAPETVFPGALTDCEKVLRFFLNQSSQFNVDASSVYLAGDSAGANLAMALCCALHEERKFIKGLVLLAPWLDMEAERYHSYNLLAPTGIVFDSAFLAYARAAYIGFEDWKNPLASPLFSSLIDLPPTIVVIGTKDPLLDQALMLRKMAKELGCKQIQIDVYPEMPHGFYLFPRLFREEHDCYERISDFLFKTRS